MVLMVYRVQFISHLRGRSLLNLAGTQPSMLFRYCLPAPNQLKHKTLSIPKEATVFQLLFMCVWGISIHASAKETTHLGYAIGFSYKFQSTPPRRRRHIPAKTVIATPVISIHASAKEATTDQAALGRALAISIHASAKEATNVPLFAPVSSRISIHASAKEATDGFVKTIQGNT